MMQMVDPMGDDLPRTASKTLAMDIRRMTSIEVEDRPVLDGHALSPTEKSIISGDLPLPQKALRYSNSLRKRSLDIQVVTDQA